MTATLTACSSNRILLVEDEAIIALAERMTLEAAGYHVELAQTGEQAVEMVSHDPSYDLILMDIDLGPGIDGPEAARRIAGTHAVPVVFLSSHSEPEVVGRTEGITSYGYIIKSTGDSVLLASVRMAFRLIEARCRERQAILGYEQSRDLLESVVRHARSAIAVMDSDLHIRHVSDEYLRRLRVDRRIVGRRVDEVPEAMNPSWATAYRAALAGTATQTAEETVYTPDGHEERFHWSCLPWYRGDNQIGGIIVHAAAITELRDAEERLHDQEQILATLLEKSPNPVVITDLDGRIVEANPAFGNLSGYSREELRRMTVADIDTDIGPTDARRLTRTITDGGSLRYRTVYRRKDGLTSEADVHVTFVPGRTDRMLAFVTPL